MKNIGSRIPELKEAGIRDILAIKNIPDTMITELITELAINLSAADEKIRNQTRLLIDGKNLKEHLTIYNAVAKNITNPNKEIVAESLKALIELEDSRANDADYWNNRGIANSNLGNNEEAIKDYSKSIELDKSNSIYWDNRGTAKYNLKQYLEAIKDYDEAIRLSQKQPHLYLRNRGRAKRELGDTEGAKKDFDEAEDIITLLSEPKKRAQFFRKKKYIEFPKQKKGERQKKRIEFHEIISGSTVKYLLIDMGNTTTAAFIISKPFTMATVDASDLGEMKWDFSGENKLLWITLRIREHTWQEDFARLRLPTSLLLLEKHLFLKTHHEIYDYLCGALEPVKKSDAGKTVILQGASGLGKTYCAQYYFYHQAAYKHQMVAWLSGASEDIFMQGWCALAQQLRNMHMPSQGSEIDEGEVIRDYCENRLGQWLFIIDDVNIEAEWLIQQLPRLGGHVLITTHQPQYHQLWPGSVLRTFTPLSSSDSQRLLESYWEATPRPQEEAALNYLSAALGGNPAALTQMALLALKKCLSFERLVNQFKQPAIRPYLLTDTVFDQLKNRTFMASVQKGWHQLLAYFSRCYPQLDKVQHEQHLKRFVDFLQNEMEMKVSFATEEIEILMYQIDDGLVQMYWQTVWASFDNIPSLNVDELIMWLQRLPLSYNKETKQWQVSLASLSALKLQSRAESLIIIIEPVTKKPTLRQTRIDIFTVGKSSEFKVWQLPTINPYFIPRPKLTDELSAKLPQKQAGEESAQLILTAATGMGGIGKTELARHFITSVSLSNHYQRRFWLTSTTNAQLRIEFRQLAVYLGLVDAEKYIEDKKLIMRVHKWLSIYSGWLMVLDNADDYNSIAAWVPQKGGAVIVITREPNPEKLSDNHILRVPLLEPKEAVDWLCQLSGKKLDSLSKEERSATKDLVYDLGYLPLAVAQAAAYLRVQSRVRIKDYHSYFSNLLLDPTLAKQEVAENDPDVTSRRVVAKTWMLSLDAINMAAKASHLMPLAQPLLASSTFFASKDIPILLLETFLKEFYQVEPALVSYISDEYVGQLIRYSLLERNSVTNALSMHRLVQEVIKTQLESNGELEAYLRKSIGALLIAYSSEEYNKHECIQLRKELLIHLQEALKNRDIFSIKLTAEIDIKLRPILVRINREQARLTSQHEAQKLVEKFNDMNTSVEDKRYYKTIINDAIALFTTYYAESSPPESLINEVLELAKANDEELYRSSISALAAVLSHNDLLNHFKSLQGLTYVLRNPAINYQLGQDEMTHVLTLVLSKVKANAVTLDALNKLLDAMIDTECPISSYPVKSTINEQLVKIQEEAKKKYDYAAAFQAGLVIKTLDKIEVDESRKEEWKRRALAFSSAVESLLKMSATIAGAVATFGAPTIFIVPELIHEARNAIINFQTTFNTDTKVSDWYADIRKVQEILAMAAVEKTDRLEDVLTLNDLSPLFNYLANHFKKKALRPSRDIQYVLVDSLEKMLLVRTDTEVLQAGFELLKTCYQINSLHIDKNNQGEKETIRAKIIEVLLTIQRSVMEEGKKQQCEVYLKTLKESYVDIYALDIEKAGENLAMIMPALNLSTIETLVLEATNRVDKLLKHNKGVKEIVISLIGEGAIVKAPVDVNQQYKGMKFQGNVDDIIKFMENETTRRVLEEDCKAAHSVISKQVAGRMAIILATLNVNRESQTPEVNLTVGGTSEANPSKEQPLLTLSKELRELMDDSLGDKKNYHFELKRSHPNTLTITFVKSNEPDRIVGKRLSVLQNALENCLNTQKAKLDYKTKLSGDNEDIVTIEADKTIINAIADLLVQQGMHKGLSDIKRYAYFFKGEKAQNPQKRNVIHDEGLTITCPMQ